MCIEFTSTDESWLIAISESSQAANTSGASPAGRKREADGDREKKEHSPSPPPLLSLYFLLYHYSCLLGSLCYVSYQLPYRHHRGSFQTICFNALPQKNGPVFQEAAVQGVHYTEQVLLSAQQNGMKAVPEHIVMLRYLFEFLFGISQKFGQTLRQHHIFLFLKCNLFL